MNGGDFNADLLRNLQFEEIEVQPATPDVIRPRY